MTSGAAPGRRGAHDHPTSRRPGQARTSAPAGIDLDSVAPPNTRWAEEASNPGTWTATRPMQFCEEDLVMLAECADETVCVDGRFLSRRESRKSGTSLKRHSSHTERY